jgi:hypothetical protein
VGKGVCVRWAFPRAFRLVRAIDHCGDVPIHALIPSDFLRGDVALVLHSVKVIRRLFQPGQRLLRRVIRHTSSIGTAITEGLSNSEHIVEASEPPRGSTWVRGARMRGVIRQLRDVTLALWTKWQQFKLPSFFVPLEFEATNIAAIDGLGTRPIVGLSMSDRRATRGTMPGHECE